MTEEERLAAQANYLKLCKERGWLDANNQHVWPINPEDKKTMARELFGLALTSSLDGVFVVYRERLRKLKLGLSSKQEETLLSEYDQMLDFAMYNFCITLDRFDHGELTLWHSSGVDGEKPNQINPHGWFELFQDAPRWKDEFSRGHAIQRGLVQPVAQADVPASGGSAA